MGVVSFRYSNIERATSTSIHAALELLLSFFSLVVRVLKEMRIVFVLHNKIVKCTDSIDQLHLMRMDILVDNPKFGISFSARQKYVRCSFVVARAGDCTALWNSEAFYSH